MILNIVLGTLVCIGLAVLLDKFIPLKFNPVISIILWGLILFLGYTLYKSIIGPVEFNKVKKARYAKVIENLKDIRAAELAHLEITGSFNSNFDSLVLFIDTAKYAIIERRDTSYADVAKNKAYGISNEGGYYIEDIIIDTLGFVPVRDSLFGETNRYKTMMNVPLDIANGAKFELRAGKYEKNHDLYSVFEAKVAKRIILSDQNKDLLFQEEQLISVDGINGPSVKVGAMDDIDTSGNWPKVYDTPKKQ